MRIVLFSNGTNMGPLCTLLHEQQSLCAIVVPEDNKSAPPVIEQAREWGCTIFKIEKVPARWQMLIAWLQSNKIDIIIAYGFPFKVPAPVLDAAAFGGYNVHYSLLPAYRGPVPLFWQLKNNEKKSGVTIHRMTQQTDGGAIALQEETPILPGETYGLLASRLHSMALRMLQRLIADIHNIDLQEQAGPGSYHSHPEKEDIFIDWARQTANEIEHQVNACNPVYNGAMTGIKGMQVRIIEVSPVDINGLANAVPGTILFADAQNGMFVSCFDDTILRLNVLQIGEGIYSGSKMALLGLSDMKFT